MVRSAAVVATQDLQANVNRCIGEIAASLSPDGLGARMGDHLMDVIPEFSATDDADFRAGLVMSCRSNIVAILDSLRDGTPAADLTPPADATAWAHELVHRGMALPALLRAYRLGHGLFVQVLEQRVSELELDPEVRWRVLADASRHVFTYIDNISTLLVDDYEAEREQWLRGAAAAQAKLVQAIIAGEVVDPAEAAATLRHDVTAPQLGLIVWRDPRVVLPDHTPSPAQTARTLATELGGSQTLIVPVGEHAAWAWTTGKGLVAEPPARSSVADERTSVATGGIHPGLEGMSRSHREARAARRVGDIFGARAGTILRYPAVALASLTSADPLEAASFAVTELGELAADTDAMRRLRATIRVHLDEALSPSRTAKRLSIHQNTVTYRVKRAEELLGRSLTDRRLELEIALRLFDGLEGLQRATGEAV